jgi:hypothetical protein
MMLAHLAVRHADGVLAELSMHGCIGAAVSYGDRVACAACRLEHATNVCSVVADEEWIAYGLCAVCRTSLPDDKVTRLVDRAIASGRLVILDDTEGAES